MKMENYVYAPVKGTVTKIFVGPAAGVEAGETLMTIDVNGASKAADGKAAVDGTATDGTKTRVRNDRHHRKPGRQRGREGRHGTARATG